MNPIFVIIIVLIAFVSCAAAVVIIIYSLSKTNKHRNDIHISGGVNIETGQISSDNNYFKGLSGKIEQTYVAQNDQNNKNFSTVTVTICNLRTAESSKILIKSQLIIGRELGKEFYTVKDDNTVSKRHCKLFNKAGALYICDLNSVNHTYLNSKIILNSEKCHCNDVVRIGNTYLQIIF